MSQKPTQPPTRTLTAPQESATPRLALSFAVLIAIPLLALNLRPAVTSMGTVLADIRSNTGMSTALASAVVAAPVWCFAAGGGLAWAMRVRWGTTRTVAIALTALMIALAARPAFDQYVLLGGTVVACLAIAVLGTMLPAIVHAAPPRGWAILTGCYVAALGSGSAVGALVTPQITGHTSWKIGASSWALLAGAGWVIWRVASRRLSEHSMASGQRTGPMTLTPRGTAWDLSVHFGLTSGVTFTIMGWLPSMLRDRSEVAPADIGWLFGIAMALGVPFALLVPKWARRARSQSWLAVLLALPAMIAIGGLLFVPTMLPLAWAVGLGLGMPAVGLALAMISLRADTRQDTAAALSSMVQGFGYAIAGAIALGAGLLHSLTGSWEWPLAALLIILVAQAVTGTWAGRPVTIYSMPKGGPLVIPHPRRSPE